MDPQPTPRHADPLGLQRALEVAGFRRDSKLGGILHGGKASFREVSSSDSLHVVVDGSQVSAHVDRISPLRSRRDGHCRYSWTRVLAHNAAVLADRVRQRVRGGRGDHRCQLDCEVVWVDDDLAPAVEVDSDTERPCGEPLSGKTGGP